MPILPWKIEEICYIGQLSNECLQVYSREHIEWLHHNLFGNSNAQEQRRLQNVVDTAQSIMRTDLPPSEGPIGAIASKAASIIKDPHHSSHVLISHLPSERRNRSLKTVTSRFKNSYFPKNIRSLTLQSRTKL